MTNLILNPILVKSILTDAAKQIAYRIPKMAPSLGKINPYTVKSWGDLATKMSKAVGHNKQVLKDIVNHVGSRFKMSTDSNFNKVLKSKEFVSRKTGLEEAKKQLTQKSVSPKSSAGTKAGMAKTALAGGVGTGLGLGLVGGAAAIGAGAIGYQYWKHDKFLEKNLKETNEQYDHFIKLLKDKTNKVDDRGTITTEAGVSKGIDEFQEVIKKEIDSDFEKSKSIKNEIKTNIKKQSMIPTKQKEFYKIDDDIFEAKTDRRIGINEWKKDWTGRATEIDKPKIKLESKKKVKADIGEEAIETGRGKKASKDLLDQIPDEIEQKIYEAFGTFPTEQDAKNYLHNSDLFMQQVEDVIAKNKTEIETVEDEKGSKRLEDAKAIIQQAVADGIIPQDLADLYTKTLEIYPDAMDFEVDEVLKTFEDTKRDEIDPYYKELADLASFDIKEAYGMLEGSRERELTSQEMAEEEEKRGIQASLEARGMTMSGEGVRRLGTEAGVIPFEGQPAEGTMQKRQQLLASSSRARYDEALQRLGRGAEGYLGTEAAGLLGIPYSSAGVDRTGTLKTGREAKEVSVLTDLISQWRIRQDLEKNK